MRKKTTKATPYRRGEKVDPANPGLLLASEATESQDPSYVILGEDPPEQAEAHARQFVMSEYHGGRSLPVGNPDEFRFS